MITPLCKKPYYKKIIDGITFIWDGLYGQRKLAEKRKSYLKKKGYYVRIRKAYNKHPTTGRQRTQWVVYKHKVSGG